MTLCIYTLQTTQTIDLAGGGRVVLHRRWIRPAESSALVGRLRAAHWWEQRKFRFGGRDVLQPRLTAWWGDPGASYVYSGIRNDPAPWPQWLAKVKERIEFATGAWYNSCLGNLYRDGRDSVSLHADDEPELGPEPTIASLSLNASRRFHSHVITSQVVDGEHQQRLVRVERRRGLAQGPDRGGPPRR